MIRERFVPFLLCVSLTACVGDTGGTRVLFGPARGDGALTWYVEETVWSGEAVDSDGTVLATWSYEVPEIRPLREDGSGPPVLLTEETARTPAEKRMTDAAEAFGEQFRAWAEAADFDALADLAREDRARAGGGPWVPYHQGLEDLSVYCSGRMASVSGTFYYSGGGPHPNTLLLGWDMDLSDGSAFTAGQLFEDTGPVTEELIRQAEERASEAGMDPGELFWPNYAQILSEWGDGAVAVTFDASGMTVSYSPYHLAPYAAGPQIFSIPRERLVPYLDEYGRSLLGS